MKVHVLQHVPFEDIGCMAGWLEKHAADISYTRFYENPALPDPRGFDLIIAMGGPMSVNDEAELPWLVDEKAFVRQAVAAGVAMVGVCLGAQLIVNALGARVYQNAQKEIGWWPIGVTQDALQADGRVFRFPTVSRVFHWHGETFDLPPGATRLASSVACQNQAFQIGRNVIGLQFHLETTPESAEAMLRHGADELVKAPYIQDADTIDNEPLDTYANCNALMARVLDYLTQSR